MTSSIFGAGNVNGIVAGTGITISPVNGRGVVTINATAGAGGVTSFNSRTGVITLNAGDVVTALGFEPASTVSPAFTGSPTAVTPAFGTNNSQLATTAFVQNAVVSSTSGVVSFNTRSGLVTLLSTDVTGALGYTPANVLGPSFSGVPTAPTAAPGNNSTQLATTAFVQAAVVASTTGVSSFNTRTGAVTLAIADVTTALSVGNGVITHNSAPTESTIKINRNASYTGGTPGYVNSAIFAETSVGGAATSFEWALTGVVQNYCPAGEHVGVYGQANSRASNTNGTFGGVFEACDMNYPTGAATVNLIGVEVDNWCNGTDNTAKRIGVDVVVGDAKQIRTGVAGDKGYSHAGVRIGAANGDNSRAAFNYGVVVNSGELAGISLNNNAPYGFGVQLQGTTAVGIDTTLATHSTGIAMRIKAGDAIAFDAYSQYQMKLNAGTGLLEFYNGATRHGYINIASGADVNFNSGSGGGSGVTSFNGNTGAITLSSSDVTGALGYTPASTANTVDLSNAQSIGGVKTFTAQPVFSNGLISQSNIYLSSGTTVGWSSSGGNVVFGSGKTNAFYLRILVDGNPFYVQCLNP